MPSKDTTNRKSNVLLRLARCAVILVMLVAPARVLGAGGGASPLRCGVTKADVTPRKPVQMAGYAARKDLSKGVHDPLSARVVAFENAGRRLVLVSVDNLGFYEGTAGYIRSALLERCDLSPSELFLCAIHTHSAPTLTTDEKNGHANNVAYTRELTATLGDLVERALEAAAPVTVGVGVGYSPVGMNRRERVAGAGAGQASIRLGRNPYGPTDKEVLVMKVAGSNGKPVAAIFDYACHSTSLGGQNLAVSGDVFGLAEQFVEKVLGPGVVAPAFVGASGDVDPWFRVRPGFDTEGGWIPEPVLLGTMLGEETVHVFRGIGSVSASGVVETSLVTMQLPAKVVEGGAVEYTGPPEVTITAGRVGEVAFVGFGCEMLTDVGMAIKRASPFRYTFLITHCNGASGYLAPAALYPEGGYEVQTSPFSAEAAEAVVRQAGKMLSALYKE